MWRIGGRVVPAGGATRVVPAADWWARAGGGGLGGACCRRRIAGRYQPVGWRTTNEPSHDEAGMFVQRSLLLEES
jgi:hypothetical protein